MWVKNKQVAIRLLSLWPNIVKMVNNWASLRRWKRPSSKSYEDLLTAVNDNLIPARLQFLSFIASLSKPFLLKHQSYKPVLPFLHDLLQLVKKVLLIIKLNHVHACSTVTELKKIELTNKDKFLKAKEINLGLGTRKSITVLKKI